MKKNKLALYLFAVPFLSCFNARRVVTCSYTYILFMDAVVRWFDVRSELKGVDWDQRSTFNINAKRLCGRKITRINLFYLFYLFKKLFQYKLINNKLYLPMHIDILPPIIELPYNLH